jgi:hypothetical protein
VPLPPPLTRPVRAFGEARAIGTVVPPSGRFDLSMGFAGGWQTPAASGVYVRSGNSPGGRRLESQICVTKAMFVA